MITHLLFDLDNTLYSARYGLEDNVSRRINDFLVNTLGMRLEDALKARAEVFNKYGTTLEWLMVEKGFTDVELYFKHVCPADEAESLPPDLDLGMILDSIPVPKAILTNSPAEHADRILNKLGIKTSFTRIFDIRFNKFKGKPRRDAFFRALDAMNAKPETTLFIDDNPNFAEGFIALGGKALLLDEFDAHTELSISRIKNIREISNLTLKDEV